MTWTRRQLAILETTTRVASVFSLFGAGFIILTFCLSRSFHKPINRLAFFASFGNIMTNVATLISQDGIRAYNQNPHAGICKMQAMFIQWFMPADAFFCAAMALNVYLTVFKKYSSHRLQKLEIRYILACYGIPFIPSLVFLFISKNRGGVEIPIFGPATLWCWISDDWKVFRLALFYGPTLVVLIFTFSVYILAGKVIFKLRGSLRVFAKTDMSTITSGTVNYGTGGTTVTSMPPAMVGGKNAPRTLTTAHGPGDTGKPSHLNTSSGVPILSDASRVGLQHHSSYSCTVESMGRSLPSAGFHGSTIANTARQGNAVEANTAAWAYCRCAMLFFLALVITWLPSMINRIYTIIYPGTTNFGLNLASALVLPCQGLWNALIYIITTFPACKHFFYRYLNHLRMLVGKNPIDLRRPGRAVPRLRESGDLDFDFKSVSDERMDGRGFGSPFNRDLESAPRI